MRKIRIFNILAAVVHWAQALYLWTLISGTEIDLGVLRFGPEISGGEFTGLVPVLDTTLESAWIPSTLSVGEIVVGFLLVCAVAHTLISTLLWERYERHLERGQNPYRWYEYSVSASLMIVALGLLSGVNSVGTLVMMVVLIAVMNLSGLIMEMVNDITSENRFQMFEVNWTPFWVGSLAGIGPWIVIGLSILESTATYDQFPDFVIFSSIVTFILFNLFALNQYLQYRAVGPWSRYLWGEYVYVFLSLTAKSILAWWVYFGAQGVSTVSI